MSAKTKKSAAIAWVENQARTDQELREAIRQLKGDVNAVNPKEEALKKLNQYANDDSPTSLDVTSIRFPNAAPAQAPAPATATATQPPAAAPVAAAPTTPPVTPPPATTPAATTMVPLKRAPVLNTLNPSEVEEGSGETEVTLTGTFFNTHSLVHVGTHLPTVTHMSDTELKVKLPASVLNALTSYQVTVENPGPTGGTSSPLTLTVKPKPVAAATAVPTPTPARTAAAATVAAATPVPATTAPATAAAAVAPTPAAATPATATAHAHAAPATQRNWLTRSNVVIGILVLIVLCLGAIALMNFWPRNTAASSATQTMQAASPTPQMSFTATPQSPTATPVNPTSTRVVPATSTNVPPTATAMARNTQPPATNVPTTEPTAEAASTDTVDNGDGNSPSNNNGDAEDTDSNAEDEPEVAPTQPVTGTTEGWSQNEIKALIFNWTNEHVQWPPEPYSAHEGEEGYPADCAGLCWDTSHLADGIMVWYGPTSAEEDITQSDADFGNGNMGPLELMRTGEVTTVIFANTLPAQIEICAIGSLDGVPLTELLNLEEGECAVPGKRLALKPGWHIVQDNANTPIAGFGVRYEANGWSGMTEEQILDYNGYWKVEGNTATWIGPEDIEIMLPPTLVANMQVWGTLTTVKFTTSQPGQVLFCNGSVDGTMDLESDDGACHLYDVPVGTYTYSGTARLSAGISWQPEEVTNP